jgi:hypothetical protein
MKKAAIIIVICGILGLPGLLALAAGTIMAFLGLTANEYQLMLDTGLKKADLIQWGCVTGLIGLAIAVVAILLLIRVLRKRQ